MSHEKIMAEAERIKASASPRRDPARDPVNQPMVNNWVEAMGDRNPAYVDGTGAARRPVAPPAMVQVWTMQGLDPLRDPADPLYATMNMLDEAGYTSVVATDCEQTYARYLRPGEQLAITTRLGAWSGPKQTALGEGYFSTTRNIWRVGDEQVATMLFRILKFKPQGRRLDRPETGRAQSVLRPQRNRDTEFFWEGTKAGELRVQRCAACGALRHPPGPSCPVCHAHDRDHVVASGRGTIHSYVVHRHPPVPGQGGAVRAGARGPRGGRADGGRAARCRRRRGVEIGAAVQVELVPSTTT